MRIRAPPYSVDLQKRPALAIPRFRILCRGWLLLPSWHTYSQIIDFIQYGTIGKPCPLLDGNHCSNLSRYGTNISKVSSSRQGHCPTETQWHAFRYVVAELCQETVRSDLSCSRICWLLGIHLRCSWLRRPLKSTRKELTIVEAVTTVRNWQ